MLAQQVYNSCSLFKFSRTVYASVPRMGRESAREVVVLLAGSYGSKLAKKGHKIGFMGLPIDTVPRHQARTQDPDDMMVVEII